MNEDTLRLLYPGHSLSELLALGRSEIDRRFEMIKAQIRVKMDGSPLPELPNVQAQVRLVCELHNAVLAALEKPQGIAMQ